MQTSATTAVVLGSLLGAVLLGKQLRRTLPEHHLSADTKDVMKLATVFQLQLVLAVSGFSFPQFSFSSAARATLHRHKIHTSSAKICVATFYGGGNMRMAI